MALLTVRGAGKEHSGTNVVKGIHFTQQQFQKIAIAGETGSGKTTLLKMIAGLVQPSEGEIFFENKRVEGPLEKLLPGHPAIAYLSQHFELRNNYLVKEELETNNTLHAAEAHRIYEICRIGHLAQRRTDQLSGGEKQRIVLARLLTGSPRLLLLDEPFSNLDAIHRDIIRSVIQDISEQLKISCMMVSHDAMDILSWADQILIMKKGEIIQQGSPMQIYFQPADTYCAALFGDFNIISPNNTAAFGIEQQTGSKQLLVRPEQISISTNGAGNLAGIIQRARFWGSYYTLDVYAGDQLLKIKTGKHNLVEGDTIHLSLLTDDKWYV